MTNIGTWAVRIIASTKGLEKGLGRAKKKLKVFGQDVNMVGSGLGLGLAGGAVAAGGAMAYFANTQRKNLDELAKTSDRLGIASQKMQVMRHAAKLSGVEVSALNMGLQRMVRRVSQAAKGSGEAAPAIKELGLNAEELKDKKPDEIFKDIASAMRQIENQSDVVRLSQKIFDSEGVMLANMYGQNLGKIEKRMAAIGTLHSDAGLDSIQEFNDELERAAVAASGAGQALLVSLAPVLTDAAQGATVLAENLSMLQKNGKKKKAANIAARILENRQQALGNRLALASATFERAFTPGVAVEQNKAYANIRTVEAIRDDHRRRGILAAPDGSVGATQDFRGGPGMDHGMARAANRLQGVKLEPSVEP